MFRYIRGLFALWRLGGVFSWMLACIWVAYPFGVETVIHPGDGLNFQAWIQGMPLPSFFTQRTLIAGEVTAVIVLVALSLLQLGVTVLLYRRLRFFVALWPLALLLVGGIANLIWYWRTGYFDLAGALAGMTPLVSAVVCLGVCEKLGADFVFGPSERPTYEAEIHEAEIRF